MGVSAAILNSVIFCHQEESNWPLGEPKNVKKKLDDIFCSTRYNKALEEIKKQMKNLSLQSKENSLKLETIKTKKHQHEKLKTNITDLSSRISSSDTELSDLTHQLIQVKKIIDQHAQLEEEARAMLTKIQKIKVTRDQLIKSNSEFREQLVEEYLETDEDLLHIQKSFESDLKKLNEDQSQYSLQLDSLRSSKSKLENALQQKVISISRLETKLQSVQKLIGRRDEEIAQFVSKYQSQIESEGGGGLIHIASFNREQLDQFHRICKSIIEAANQQLIQHRNATQEKRNQMSSSIGSLKTDLSSSQSSVRSLLLQKKNNEAELQTISNDIHTNQQMISQMDAMEQKMKEEEKRLEELQAENTSHNFDHSLLLLQDEKDGLEGEMRKINDSLSSLHKFSSLKSKLDIKREDRITKQNAYQQQMKEVLRSTNEKFLENFQSSDPSSLKDYLIQKHNLITENIKQTEKEFNSVQGKYAMALGNYNTVSQQLSSYQSSFHSLMEKVKKESNNSEEELPTLIKRAEETVQSKQRNKSMTKSAQLIYNNFVNMAKENHECPLCERSFDNSSQLTDLLDKLNEILAQVPTTLQTTSSDLLSAQSLLSSLQSLLPSYNEAIRIHQSELPKLTSDQQLHLSLSSDLKLQLDTLKLSLSSHRDDEKITQNMISNVDKSVYLYKEFLLLQKEEKELESSLPSIDLDHLSLDDLTRHLDINRSKVKEIEDKMKEIRSNRNDYQTKIQKLYQSIAKYNGELKKAANSSSTLDRLRVKTADLTKHNIEIDQQIAAHHQIIQSKSSEIDQSDLLLKSFLMESNQKEKNIQEKWDQIREKHINLDNLSKQIADATSNQPNALDSLLSDLSLLTKQRSEIESDIAQTNQRASEIEQLVYSIQQKLSVSLIAKRNLDDNLKDRDQQKQIKQLTDELVAIESSSNPLIANPKAIIHEKSIAEQKYAAIKSKKDTLDGSRRAYHDQIKSFQRDLSHPSFDGIDDQYLHMTIKVKTLSMAKDDLDRYYIALDKALMKYHTMKIEEINKILKELWQTTYQGQDIDSVEIRADCESKSRSFNYRVCMVKGDTELDMRGRCSAGQKVLTSLIIRLALAETLGVNCGIIALDEPTTNLDRANVESFAKSLVQSLFSSFLLILFYLFYLLF